MSTPTKAGYTIQLVIPAWVPGIVGKLIVAASIFAAGYMTGGGKLTLPSIHWPTPTPAPSRPDWLPPNPPPAPTPTPVNEPPVTPVNEWRPLPWAHGWEGFGHDVDGVFMVSTWRRLPEPVQVQVQPVQLQPVIPQFFRSRGF